MRTLIALLALTTAANANGAFMGGFADGFNQSRALQLDAQDGGYRYPMLMQQKRNEEILEMLRKQRQLIEDLKSNQR